jgi:hypothetical protein
VIAVISLVVAAVLALTMAALVTPATTMARFLVRIVDSLPLFALTRLLAVWPGQPYAESGFARVRWLLRARAEVNATRRSVLASGPHTLPCRVCITLKLSAPTLPRLELENALATARVGIAEALGVELEDRRVVWELAQGPGDNSGGNVAIAITPTDPGAAG